MLHPLTAHLTAWSAIAVVSAKEQFSDISDIQKRPVVAKLKAKVTKKSQKMCKRE